MSRGVVPGLATPRPIGETLPGIYQEDPLAVALTRALDDVLAPIVSTIDNIDAYLDPALTPDDFIEWLAGWVGLLPDETWPIERRRALVAFASHLYRNRGTAAGLQMHVSLLTAADVDVTDSGGALWSTTAGTSPPGDGSLSVTVTVHQPKRGAVEPARIDALVAAAKPAHVVHQIAIAGASEG